MIATRLRGNNRSSTVGVKLELTVPPSPHDLARVQSSKERIERQHKRPARRRKEACIQPQTRVPVAGGDSYGSRWSSERSEPTTGNSPRAFRRPPAGSRRVSHLTRFQILRDPFRVGFLFPTNTGGGSLTLAHHRLPSEPPPVAYRRTACETVKRQSHRTSPPPL
jgi:hypothetical protein